MRGPWRSLRSTRRAGELLGVVRLHADANYESGEYAILIRSDLKGHGLGWLLMQIDDRICSQRGAARDRGPGAAREHDDVAMCRELGFTCAVRSGRSKRLCRQAIHRFAGL